MELLERNVTTIEVLTNAIELLYEVNMGHRTRTSVLCKVIEFMEERKEELIEDNKTIIRLKEKQNEQSN